MYGMMPHTKTTTLVCAYSWSSLVEGEMNNWIGPIVKYEWNDAMPVLQLFWICHKDNSLPIGPIQPSSPSAKELLGLLLALVCV